MFDNEHLGDKPSKIIVAIHQNLCGLLEVHPYFPLIFNMIIKKYKIYFLIVFLYIQIKYVPLVVYFNRTFI